MLTSALIYTKKIYFITTCNSYSIYIPIIHLNAEIAQTGLLVTRKQIDYLNNQSYNTNKDQDYNVFFLLISTQDGTTV